MATFGNSASEDSSVKVLYGLDTSFTIPANQLWRGAFRYWADLSAWVLEAAGVTQ